MTQSTFKKYLLINNKYSMLDTEKLRIYDSSFSISYKTKKELLDYRPNLGYMDKPRNGRNYVMKQMLLHMRKANIKGSLISLAAERMPESFFLWKNHIDKLALNVNFKKKDFEKLKKYNPYIMKAFKFVKYDTNFEVEYGNILDVMSNHKKEFSIIDLDTTQISGKEFMSNIAKSVSICAAKKSILSLAYVSGRKPKHGDFEINTIFRPFLRKQLNKHFKILKMDNISYKDNIPMRVDIFTLERKAA